MKTCQFVSLKCIRSDHSRSHDLSFRRSPRVLHPVVTLTHFSCSLRTPRETFITMGCCFSSQNNCCTGCKSQWTNLSSKYGALAYCLFPVSFLCGRFCTLLCWPCLFVICVLMRGGCGKSWGPKRFKQGMKEENER